MLLATASKLVLLCLLSSVSKAEGKCYCKPCGPILGKKGFGFVGFTRSQDPAIYTLFDFSKLTTVVLLGTNNQTKEFVCYAHARQVKVVLIAHPPTGILWRKKLREQYIEDVVKKVADNNLDGINVDYEGYIGKWRNPLSYNGLSLLMKEFRAKLQQLNPVYELSMDWLYCPDCSSGRSYDYSAIKGYVDYFLVMFYDMQWSETNVNNGLCETKSQNRLNEVRKWAKQWVTGTGIPRHKLVFAFPWYGFMQPCFDFEPSCGTCYTKCSLINKPELQRCYISAEAILRDRIALGGRQWNNDTQSPCITWLSGNQYYQMHYDDPRSLKLRYDMALRMGVRGTGTWHITCLDFENAEAAKADREAMWGVIPTGKEIPAI